MSSLYEELAERLAQDPRLTKRGGARYDLGLLLFDFRDSLHALWKAADRSIQAGDEQTARDLREAVETLRTLFGERAGQTHQDV